MKKFKVGMFLLLPALLFAHGGIDHSKEATSKKDSKLEKKVYKKINKEYKKSVKAIFKEKCLSCHSSGVSKKNQYYEISKQAIKHLDMKKDFPFKSHLKPIDDLNAMKDAIDKKRMPPSYFDKQLSEDEILVVNKWLKDSLNEIDWELN